MNRLIIFAICMVVSFSTSFASECTTSTPVTSQIVSDAAATIDSGGVYNAAGTATCPDQMGPQGPKGDTGAAGLQGIPGAQGVQGLQGIAGPTGAKGDTGAQGAQGVAGAKGDKGDTGFRGVDGVAGSKGDKGDKGATGLAEATGTPGAVVNLDKYNANIAAVAALSIPHISENKHFAFSGGAADTMNAAAVSLNGAIRIDRTWQAGVGAAFSADGKATVVKGALTGEW
jgi:hypothetical protein